MPAHTPVDPTVHYHRLMTTFAQMHISPRVFAGLNHWASRSDVVSAAWVNAFNSRDRIEGLPEGQRPAYLFRILANKLNEILRAVPRAGVPVALHPDLTESGVRLGWWEPADPAAGPPEVTAEQERRARVVAAVAELPDREREALVLQRYHGWKLREIAAHLGCTTGAVAGLHRQALARLRERLGDLAGEGS